MAPHAAVLYAADGRWWGWHKDELALQAFAGCKVTTEAGLGEGDPGSEAYILRHDAVVYSRDPSTLAHGGNGGYQALNFAGLAGAARIILLGFDMQCKGRRQNWHAGHKVKVPERWIQQWIPRFREIAGELKKDGIEVINASEETALDAFPRRPIAELLPDPQQEEARQ